MTSEYSSAAKLIETGDFIDWELYRPTVNQEPAPAPVKMSEKVSEKSSEKTSEKILRLLADNPKMTIAEMARIAGTTTRTIERNLKKLQDSGQLERIGADKGGHWEVQK